MDRRTRTRRLVYGGVCYGFNDGSSSLGHLNVLFKMFSFLKSKHNGVTVFDPAEPEIDQTQFPTEDWSATPYGICKEDVPLNSPPLEG